MEYALTEEDIAKLGLLDAMPGEPATAAEMQSLGVSEQQPAVVADPAAQQAQQQDEFAYLTDPYGSLSKTQRRMLAFSAIQDAGMALLGKEGNAFNSLMGDFTARADAARKAKAARAQQQMMSTLMTGGVGSMPREQIIALAAAGLIDPQTAKLMIEQQEAAKQADQDIFTKQSTINLIDALANDPNLGQILGKEGTLRTALATIAPGFQTEYEGLKARVNQLKGGAFLEAYDSLRGGGQITELEGIKAEAALARLDTAQGADDFRQALAEYRFYMEQGIRRQREGVSYAQDSDHAEYWPGDQSGGATEPLTNEQLEDKYREE